MNFKSDSNNNSGNKAKKIGKILLYNFAFIIVVLILIEIVSYFVVFYKNRNAIIGQAKIEGYKPILTYQKPAYLSYEERKAMFRPVSYGDNPNKRPIALFGCSYTWGSYMENEDTFAAVLSRLTGRTVYNRGLFATGVPFLYYQLSDKDIQKEIGNPEYIIYTLIDNHFFRSLTIRSWCMDYIVQYSYRINSKGELELVKPVFLPLYSLFSVFMLQEFMQKTAFKYNLYKKPFIKMIDESNKLIKEKFPDTTFVILVYQDLCWKYDNDATKNSILKHFEDEGIKLIYTDNLVGEGTLYDKKYIASDGFHPSAETWKLIVPKLIEELNL